MPIPLKTLRECFWVLIVMLFISDAVIAHGGGLDKCGGHNDRKRGDYHVHDQAKHCSCNPQSGNCRSTTEAKPSFKKEFNPVSPRSKQ